jgi:hypothetical protein
MKDTTSTNIFSTFCHRMTHFFSQDPFFNKCQRAKCVLQGAAFIGGKACKMRKVTARALLRLVVWSE